MAILPDLCPGSHDRGQPAERRRDKGVRPPNPCYGQHVAVPTLLAGGKQIAVTSTLVMGVVNASADSFSDAGRYRSLDKRLARAAALVDAGADMIDVGGQSAITGRPETDAAAERDSVVPIVEWLVRNHPGVLVSVDTYKPSVAEASLAAGASIINDVSGLMHPELATLCAGSSAALVVMHTRARPKVRLQDPDFYPDIVADVAAFLAERIAVAESRGLSREAIILDPGPDFSKTPHQTVKVLRHLQVVRDLGRPLLLALSRKDFLGAITGRSPSDRDAATFAALAYYCATPGNIVRVHDVAGAVDVIRTIDVLAGRKDVPADYLLPQSLRHQPAT
jgi:dihydropteroate synthase